MALLPFVCLGIGIFLGLFIKNQKFLTVADKVSTVSLILLMITIGTNIGLNDSIMSRFTSIGFHCIVISLSAVFFSILMTYLCEKTVLPLEDIDRELKNRKLSLDTNSLNGLQEVNLIEEGENKTSHLVWIMPGSIILGLVFGLLSRGMIESSSLDSFFTVFLIILYICVGISQGSNKEVFIFVKELGLRVLWLSAAILAGSLIGGIVSGVLLKIPLHVSVISSSGMSFYSITGAFMTQAYGVEVGTYGFIVNVLREFFTVLLMPMLIKISKGSPIAGGAAGNMDTMLAPVTKFVGAELGLVTLITGTILTFLVPFLLPALSAIL
ncbi:lysine exporter LysO family protein [Anaerovorax sp. IOR16]|uniref:lysine exporter LysO family protein n=1 Tax=Anaerovorax sp. IOR16 TaxID=2773458 RepID=UPI0019CFF4E0|nr:lysine exporter LysO family protein [Anaerovorax sp. IOR16]